MIRSKEQMMVDEIMDCFDFTKTHEVMVHLNWKIATNEGMQIPDEMTLRRNARRLLIDCINNSEESKEQYCTIRTGPFKVGCLRYDNETSNIELEFVVTQWDSTRDWLDE